jgi:hypothetical protein
MTIYVDIPLKIIFDLPEGCYRGKLAHVIRKSAFKCKGSKQDIRLLFEMDIPSIKNKSLRPFAGRNFSPDMGARGELRLFLEQWLGSKFFEDNAVKKIDLESLIGEAGDFIITHMKNEGYEKPLVIIQDGFPVGRLPLTEAPEPEGGKD